MNDMAVSSLPPTPSVDHERIDKVFEAQRANVYRMRNTSYRERRERLSALLDAILKNRPAIRDALYADFRKPAAEVDLTEIFVVTAEIKHTLRHLKKWMKPKRVRPTRTMLSTRGEIRYEARGHVLIISPWNFPLNLTLGPLVSAVAAGNCVVVKPSEFTPHTSELMKKLVENLFPENEVALFLGDKETATALLQKPFNHIFFTGSPEVGKVVMKAAAEHLATVTLELGGKSPVIVDETADPEDAAEKIAWGKYMNNGQTCLAPDYLYVHEAVYPRFLEAFRAAIVKDYGETDAARRQTPDYARIISARHHTRLRQLYEASVAAGGRLELGGHSDEVERYFEPTVLCDTPLNAPLMQEEIFGPILPILRYRDIEEPLRTIQSLPRPLALYVFSRNRRRIEHILRCTSAGGTCINDVVVHYMHLNLPFGGINNSGFGSSHGFYGFKAFSHERAVLRQGRLSPLKWFYPPYTPRVHRLIDWLIQYV